MSDRKTSDCSAHSVFCLIFLAVVVILAPVNLVYGAPTITYNNITPEDGATFANNWVNISINSSEVLNQSVLEWGWTNGSLTNFSMINESSDNLTWSYNISGLSAGRYNYTVWVLNTTDGNWANGTIRFVTVSAISSCQNITVGSVTYTLIQSVNSSGTCFNILANNITIDGAGYTINYSKSLTGYAINNSLGYNLTTIKNLSIVQENATVQNAYAIVLNETKDGFIINSTIRTTGTLGHGIVLDSSNLTTISGNNVTVLNATSDGILLISSFSNTISGGSIYSVNISYGLSNSGTDNNFQNTNFTGSRNISFLDAISSFNYYNETSGSILLKTNVSAPSSITRTLVTWSNVTMQWNDTDSTAGITANYILTGLLPSTQYKIYNVSGVISTNIYNSTTDASGILQPFTINLSGLTSILVDSVPNITYVSLTNGSSYNDSALSAIVLNITTNEPAAWCGFSLNGTANMTMNGTSTSWNYTGISGASDGLNNITFYCNDSRSNIGSATKYFTKDNTPPTMNDIPSCTDRTTSSVKIVWNVSNATNNLVYYRNSGTLDSYLMVSGGSSSQITLPEISSRTYEYYVISCDAALNCAYPSAPTPSTPTTCAKLAVTTTTTDDSSSTGTGTGGGDTSSGLSKSWSSISSGSTAVMALTSSSVDVTDIIFKATQALSKVKISVSKLSAKPSATTSTPPGSVYQYVSITPENITDAKITATTISFRVNSTWIVSNLINSSTIKLYRYSGGTWTALATHDTGTSGSYKTFIAETPGFSYFAISGKLKGPSTPADSDASAPATNQTVDSTTANNTSVTLSTLSSNTTSQNNGTVSSAGVSGDTKNSLIWFIVIIIAVVVVLVFHEKLKINLPTKLKLNVPKFYAGQKTQTPEHKYTFNPSEVKKAELVYKPQQKEEKVKYAYKPKN